MFMVKAGKCQGLEDQAFKGYLVVCWVAKRNEDNL